MYDRYKNDRRNKELENQYKKQQRVYKKQKRKIKRNYENLQNESVANEEAMAKKIKNLTNKQHTTKSYNIKTTKWEPHGSRERNVRGTDAKTLPNT